MIRLPISQAAKRKLIDEAWNEAKLRKKASVFKPHPGPQTMFLQHDAFELLYGGAAGGGKSVGLLACATQGAGLKDYAGILFRKTYKQLSEPGGLVERSREFYPSMGARYHGGHWRWVFPTGAQIVMRHLQHTNDRYSYQGAEYSFIGFDQIEQFDEEDYLYLFSRARSRDPRIKARVRTTANPGAAWLLKRYLPWLGTESELEQKRWPRAELGEVLYFIRENEEDVLVEPEHPDALGRTFIAATVYDNPTLMENDPEYIRRLRALPYVERRRLLDSDWHIESSAGNIYKREWIVIAEIEYPVLESAVRAFDFAATEKQTQKDNPDMTATVKMGRGRHGTIWVVDSFQEDTSPAGQQRLLLNYHHSEPREVAFCIPQDPGQAGKKQAVDYANLLQGRVVYTIPRNRDKVFYAGPLSAAFEFDQVRILKAPWNAEFINHLTNFPSVNWHDDIVDAANDCFYALTTWMKGERGWAY